MPRSHIHGSPRGFYYGLNLTDDPGNANFSSPMWMHYIRMIKYYYVWLRMLYRKLRTNTDCHECTSVANPASSPWMCDLGIKEKQHTNQSIMWMWLQNHLLLFLNEHYTVYTRVGISGTTAKSRQRKFVPSSHTGPLAVVVSSRRSQTKVFWFFVKEWANYVKIRQCYYLAK